MHATRSDHLGARSHAARTVATTMQAERHTRKTHGLRPRVLPIATDGVGHGVLQEPRLHGGSVSTADRVLTLRGGARAYFAADLSDVSSGEQPRGWSHLRYEQLKLRGRSLRFTVDLSRVGCGCVAALYLVDMPGRPDAAQQRSGLDSHAQLDEAFAEARTPHQHCLVLTRRP